MGDVVTYKKEIKLWLDFDVTGRALKLRDHADRCLVQLELQHERIASMPNLETASSWQVQVPMLAQVCDLDFFFVALHRLADLADVVKQAADPRNVLTTALADFNRKADGTELAPPASGIPATIKNVRIALEHFTNLEIAGGLGFGRGEGCWYVTYRERMWDTAVLLEAARELHRAIRSAIDSEAAADFRGSRPFITVG